MSFQGKEFTQGMKQLVVNFSSVRLGFCLCHYFLIFDNIVSV